MRKYLVALLCLAGASVTTPAFADGGLTFQIVGDTFSQPFTITNTSTGSETVVGFGVTLISPYGFDTVDGGFGNDPVPFSPNGASAALTGYTGPSSFADGASSLMFTFTDFQVGESFVWDIDVDHPDFLTVIGNQLIGSTGYADFSNGLRGLGTFQALGTNGSQFVITTFTPTPGVPEPATWAMMIGGVGMAGGALRRRRTVSTKVSFA
jgi:hypothetical protein